MSITDEHRCLNLTVRYYRKVLGTLGSACGGELSSSTRAGRCTVKRTRSSPLRVQHAPGSSHPTRLARRKLSSAPRPRPVLHSDARSSEPAFDLAEFRTPAPTRGSGSGTERSQQTMPHQSPILEPTTR